MTLSFSQLQKDESWPACGQPPSLHLFDVQLRATFGRDYLRTPPQRESYRFKFEVPPTNKTKGNLNESDLGCYTKGLFCRASGLVQRIRIAQVVTEAGHRRELSYVRNPLTGVKTEPNWYGQNSPKQSASTGVIGQLSRIVFKLILRVMGNASHRLVKALNTG